MDWTDELMKAVKNVKHSDELKLSVIENDSRDVFESKGGNESIYYDIKYVVNEYCHKVAAKAMKEIRTITNAS